MTLDRRRRERLSKLWVPTAYLLRAARPPSAERADARRTMIGSGDRSQRVRTYNFPQNRVTDHRIGLDLYKLDKIMLGDLDDLIEALQTYDKEQRLKTL